MEGSSFPTRKPRVGAMLSAKLFAHGALVGAMAGSFAVAGRNDVSGALGSLCDGVQVACR